MRAAARFVLLSVLFAAALAVPWSCVVTGMVTTDPLFGSHADLLCPRVCRGCHGPYRFMPSDQGHTIYCSDPAGMTSSTWPKGGRAAIEPYKLPGQEALIALTMAVALLPLGVVIALLWRRQKRREDR
jgi:hypothetical protein